MVKSPFWKSKNNARLVAKEAKTRSSLRGGKILILLLSAQLLVIIKDYKYFVFELFGGQIRVSNMLDLLNCIHLGICCKILNNVQKRNSDITEGLAY